MGEHSLKDEFWMIATKLHVGLLKQLSAEDFYKVLVEAKQQAIPIGWRDIDPVVRKINQSNIPSIPNRVIDFIVSYCENIEVRNVLDPWANIGVLLLALREKMDVQTTAYAHQQENIRIAEIFATDGIQWSLREASEESQSINEKFDLVISTPALGLPSQKKEFKLPEGTLFIEDSETNLILLSACQKLSDHGQAVFLLPESFYTHDKADSVVGNLKEFGLFINAIVSLPQKTLHPATGASTALFFISRKATDTLFIGHLSDDINMAGLLNNLIKRKKGVLLETGRLINPGEYKSWRQYSLLVEIEEIFKHSKLPIVKLEKIAIKFNFGKRGDPNGFEEGINSVFLPLLTDLPVHLDASEIKHDPSHYVQLILKPEVALADYVAGYFSTEAGKKVRAALAYGNSISRLSKLDLFDVVILLPSIEEQQKVIETHRTIRELSYRLQQFEKELYKSPNQVNKLKKDIEKLDQKESFEYWVESLPFPMASILWRYHASLDTSHKIEHLLHFFEATAEFITTILLSAYYSDNNIFTQYKDVLFPEMERSASNNKFASIKRATFGYWVKTGERLAKQTRKMLGNPVEKLICTDLFRTDLVEFIQTIASKEIFGIFNNALKIRNHQAHSGIAGELTNSRTLSLIESELDKLRALFSSIFEEFIFFTPISNQYRDGLFTNKISKLMGSRQIFKDDHVITIIPLDSEMLYLAEKGFRKPLELLPFIKMTSSPENTKLACYFYNRMDDKEMAWVTYHYEAQPELFTNDKKLEQIIRTIEK